MDEDMDDLRHSYEVVEEVAMDAEDKLAVLANMVLGLRLVTPQGLRAKAFARQVLGVPTAVVLVGLTLAGCSSPTGPEPSKVNAATYAVVTD